MIIKPVYSDFSHTAILQKNKKQERLFHEITLREAVHSRTKDDNFVKAAAKGWEESQRLKKEKNPPQEYYLAWLKPFSELTEEDLKTDIETHWERNPAFDWIMRELANRMGYSKQNKMPVTFVSGAIKPMVQIAMKLFYKDLVENVIDPTIIALDIEMKNGLFTRSLAPVDKKVYARYASLGQEDCIIIGDHYMRQEGFNEEQNKFFFVIFEADGTCNQLEILARLDKYFV